MECVILYRLTDNCKIEFVRDAPMSISPAVFPNRDTAIDYALDHFAPSQADYQIVELDEL
jgi:hypothetical protein